MVRTQIYLTDTEHKKLHALSRRHGASLSALIRTAIDRFLATAQPEERLALMREARGIWKDRSDLPDFAALRREFDRWTSQGSR